MTSPLASAARYAVAAAVALTVTACSATLDQGTHPAMARPVSGGTLNFVSAGDFDHADPLSAYSTNTIALENAWTRQLVSYYPSNDPQLATMIAPDAATTVPTRANKGISANGLTYTFHLKAGVDWDSSPPRQVTSMDFLREFKAMCNPVVPVGNPLYYVPVIQGMTAYCNAYAAAFKNKTPTPANMTAFQDSHSISGIATPSRLEIQFTLRRPANDFLNILAMPFASARPIEYDSYVPDSPAFRQHTLSDGPYRISSYTPGKEIVLTRNPAWKQSTDALRHAYVSQIAIHEGTTRSSTALDDVEAGTDDLMWDLTVPTPQIASLSRSPNLHIYRNTGNEDPYLVFNLQSPDANHAMSKLGVRQAIEYAVNKLYIAKLLGGTALNPVLNEAIAPGNAGYTSYDYYPTANDAGDPAKCKQDLAAAGYPKGMVITDVYRDAGDHPEIFAAIKSSLASCGITVNGVPMQEGPYYDFLSNGPNSAKPNKWDISEPGWAPDWLGNNGRANFVPLFYPNCSSNTSNYGCYNDPKTDTDIQQALTAPNAATAGPSWARAGQQVMKDAAIVPITSQDIVLYANSHAHGLVYDPLYQQYNVTQLWLSR